MSQKVSPPGWRTTELVNVCEDITVGHVGPMADQYLASGVPFLRSQNVRPFRFDPTELRYISPGFHAKLKKSTIRPGDVVVTRTGANTGQCCVIPDTLTEANCADLVIIHPSKRVDSWFLMYLLNSDWGRATIAGSVVGAAQHHFNIGVARKMRVELPPVHIQSKISSILRRHDALIENNTRRIAILEAMAQALYREWFVRFRFPGHENLPLVPSPLGEIPLGWNVVRVEEAVYINPRTTVPREGEKHFVPMGAVPHNTMLIDVSQVEMRTGNSGSKFKNGDSLFARITPCLENGKTAFVAFLPTEDDVAFGSTEFIVLRSKSVCPEYVYLLARSDRFRDNAIKSMSGATGRQRVQEKCFDSFLLAHPDRRTIEAFSSAVKPMFQAVFNLTKKNALLCKIRDLLLPG